MVLYHSIYSIAHISVESKSNRSERIQLVRLQVYVYRANALLANQNWLDRFGCDKLLTYAFKFPGWKCPLRNWKYFAAVIAAFLYSQDRLVRTFFFCVCVSANHKRASISIMAEEEFVFIDAAVLFMAFWLLCEDYYNKDKARKSYSSVACEFGDGLRGKFVLTFHTNFFFLNWHTAFTCGFSKPTHQLFACAENARQN